MSKVRPTYQQKLFSDEELGLPVHDAIVRWCEKLLKERPAVAIDRLRIKHTLDEQGNPCRWKVLTDYAVSFSGKRYLSDSEKYGLAHHLRSWGALFAPEPPPPPPMKFMPAEWEPIIKGRSGGIAAAFDLRANLVSPTLGGVIDVEIDWAGSLPQSETLRAFTAAQKPILCDGSRFWRSGEPTVELPAPRDLVEQVGRGAIYGHELLRFKQFRWRSSESHRPVVFEAKTKITAAGELIRQLKLYQTLQPEALFAVVAPAAEFRGEMKDILIEQGFSVLPYLTNG